MRDLPKPPAKKPEDFQVALQHMFKPAVQQYIAEVNSEYLHWEKARYHPTPEGLSPEQAWATVKWVRLGQMLPVPLQDVNGRSFRYWLPNPALETLHEVDRWGGAALALDDGVAPHIGAMRERVLISSLMEEAIATSQIEGAATTRKVAKEMLRTNRRPRSRGEQMIVNSYRTIQMLRDHQKTPLTPELLFEIQRSMTSGTLDDPTAAGRFRTPTENVEIIDVTDNTSIYTPPPAEQLPERIKKLIDFANAPTAKDDFIHPLVKAAILHFWLEFEHPFVDGNGRTGRGVFYWYMLKCGYWLFEFLTISRIIHAAPKQYYRSFLYSEEDDNDLTYSILYMLRATQRALAALREYLAEKQQEQQNLAAVLRRYRDLNHRQRALIDHALRHPNQVYTFLSHRNSHGITNVTARSDLLGLLDKRLLTETKLGRRQRGFLPAEDLAEKLGASGERVKKRKS